MEASGTGNMKFMMNGAVTIGALDGANVEIASEVGAENIYIFGHTVEDLARLRAGGYDPARLVRKDDAARAALDALRTNRFNSAEPGLFAEIAESLTSGGDPYFLLADLPLYRETQARIDRDFADRAAWLRRSVLNCARSAYFSADRTIRQYARDVWGLSPAAGAAPLL
jgi:starch phosphorylase